MPFKQINSYQLECKGCIYDASVTTRLLATWDAMKRRNIYLIFSLILFTTSSMFAKDYNMKKQREAKWGTFYCDTHQLWYLTPSHTWHFTKRRAMTSFYRWRNWDTRQLSCSSGHIMKSGKRQSRPGCSPAGPRGSPLPTQPWASRVPRALPCQQNCSRNVMVTVTSSGQWGQSLRLPWQRPSCRAQTPSTWGGRGLAAAGAVVGVLQGK